MGVSEKFWKINFVFQILKLIMFLLGRVEKFESWFEYFRNWKILVIYKNNEKLGEKNYLKFKKNMIILYMTFF